MKETTQNLVHRNSVRSFGRTGLKFLAWMIVIGFAAVSLNVAQADTIKLGIVTFLSGPAAGPFGVPAKDAADLIIDAINQGKLPEPYNSVGMAGLTIEPVVVDEAGGSAQQVTEFRNLVQRRNVDAVVGYISSGSCLAIAPVAEELEMLTVLFDCGTPRIFEESSYQYVFRTSAHAAMDNIGAARYVMAKYPNTLRIGGINQNYAWGQDSWRDFILAMNVLQPESEVVAKQFPKIFAGQYSSEISSMLVNRPDIVHSSLWGGDLESFVYQAAGRGLNTRTLLVLTTAESSMFRLGEKLPDGVVVGGRGPYGVFARPTPLNMWFRQAYQERFGSPPVYPAYQMAQAILGLKIAVEKAANGKQGFPATLDVISAFEYLEYESFGTDVSMALGKGHQAITEAAYGSFKFDQEKNEATIVDMIRFGAKCVNPPEGTSTVAWIEAGMPGAVCKEY